MSDFAYDSFLLTRDDPDDASETTVVRLSTDELAWTLVTGYTPDPTHVTLQDALDAGATQVATTDLTGATTSSGGDAGRFSADSPLFEAVPAGDPLTDLLLYKVNGGASTSLLLAHWDSFTPITPDGGNIRLNIPWIFFR